MAFLLFYRRKSTYSCRETETVGVGCRHHTREEGADIVDIQVFQ